MGIRAPQNIFSDVDCCRQMVSNDAIGHGIGGMDIPAKMARLAKSLSQEYATTQAPHSILHPVK
jgi:hypothetical protein